MWLKMYNGKIAFKKKKRNEKEKEKEEEEEEENVKRRTAANIRNIYMFSW